MGGDRCHRSGEVLLVKMMVDSSPLHQLMVGHAINKGDLMAVH